MQTLAEAVQEQMRKPSPLVFGVPFTLCCSFCDAGMDVDTYADALIGGWTSIVYDDGLSWNYLGICPDCYVDACT